MAANSNMVPEYTVYVPVVVGDSTALTISVLKVGGGLPGHMYGGDWEYKVTYGSEVIAAGVRWATSLTDHEGASRAVGAMVGGVVDQDGTLALRLMAWGEGLEDLV